MTNQRAFGSKTGTEAKLQTVFDYANFYTSALKLQPERSWNFRLTYLDAFAGSGRFIFPDTKKSELESLPIIDGVEEFDEVVEGSALRSLKVEYPFDRYIFSDIKRKNVKELSQFKNDFPHLSDRIEITNKDANVLVTEFCRSMDRRDRAIVFLDPFGNQVNFETLRAIASTGKIDLWYLFPSWWGVVRQISNDGKVHEDAAASLSRLFGTDDWRNEVVRLKSEPDLLDPDRTVWEKTATADSITRYMIERMQTLFGDGVSKKWLPLGKNGAPGYSLIFACANQAELAKNLAHKVAIHVMKRD